MRRAHRRTCGVAEPSGRLQRSTGVFDAEVPVDVEGGGHRRVAEQIAHHLDGGAARRSRVAKLWRNQCGSKSTPLRRRRRRTRS